MAAGIYGTVARQGVYILPDNDAVGMEYAQEAASALTGAAKSVSIVDWSGVWPDMPEHADVTDILERFGSYEGWRKVYGAILAASPYTDAGRNGGSVVVERPFHGVSIQVYGGSHTRLAGAAVPLDSRRCCAGGAVIAALLKPMEERQAERRRREAAEIARNRENERVRGISPDAFYSTVQTAFRTCGKINHADFPLDSAVLRASKAMEREDYFFALVRIFQF